MEYTIDYLQLYGYTDSDNNCHHLFLFGDENNPQGSWPTEPGIVYTTANHFIRSLNFHRLKYPNKSLIIHMKTNGGDWREGMAMYDAIKFAPFPTAILNYTHARSMSSIIFQAADYRMMMPNSQFMYHMGTLEYSGSFKQVLADVENTKIDTATMFEIYANAMEHSDKFKNFKRDEIIDYLTDHIDEWEDVFLTAEQAVEWGFADEVFDGDWTRIEEDVLQRV